MRHIYTDGSGQGGNPEEGVGAAAFLITNPEEPDEPILHASARVLCNEVARTLGLKQITNNTAEYIAMQLAVEYVRDHFFILRHSWVLHSDSQLVVNQIYGKYATDQTHLQQLRGELLHMCEGIDIRFVWVPRTNKYIKEADSLGRSAIKTYMRR